MLKSLAKVRVPLLREVSKWPKGFASVRWLAICPVVLWISMVAVAFKAVGSAYTVAGRYAFEAPSLGAGAPEGWANQGTFEVTVDGCRWRIECQPEPMERPGGPPLIYRQFLASHDGQTIYELRATEIPPGFLTSSGAPPENYGHAEMENGPVPQRLDSRLQHLWLGLASHCHFAVATPGLSLGLSLPPEDPQVHDNSRVVRADWQLNPARPRLPMWVAFLGGEVYADTRRPMETNVFLEVLSWTNAAGLALPGSFEITTSFRGMVLERTKAWIDRLEPVASLTDFQPKLTGTNFIVDRRLTNAPPFLAAEHLTTRWPTLEETRRAHLGKVALQRQSSPSRWLVWSLIAVILIGPLAALFWWRTAGFRTPRKHQPKEPS